MSLKDCIRRNVEQGNITLEEGQALEARYDSIVKRLGLRAAGDQIVAELEAEAAERRRIALLTETARRAREADLLNHRNLRGQPDPAEALVWLLEHTGQARFQDVASRAKALQGLYMSKMERLLYEFRGKAKFSGDVARRFGRTAARLDNVVRELFDEDTGDRAAKEFATAWSTVSEEIRQAFNAAGGSIGKLEKWGLPQHHNREALLRYGRDRWVAAIMPRLDRERMRHPLTTFQMTDDELRQSLAVIWERITTDGWSDREPSGVRYGTGALYKQHADHRFLIFKSADDWLAYQRDFGEGDAFAAMMGHVSTMTRDIAFMERLGPNPAAMMEYLKQVVRKRAAMIAPNLRIRQEQLAAIERVANLAWRSSDAQVLLGDAGRVLEIDVTRLSLDQVRGKREVVLAARALIDRLRRDRGFTEQSARDLFDAVFGTNRLSNADDWVKKGPLARSVRDQIFDALAVRLDTARDLLEMTEAYGRLDPGERQRSADRVQQIMAQVSALSPETAEQVRAQLDQVRGEIVSPYDDPESRARSWSRTADVMFGAMRGAYTPVNVLQAGVVQGLINLTTAASLGSAFLSALSDPAYGLLARKMAGLPQRNLVRSYIDRLRPGGQQVAVRAGLALDSALHTMHREARFAESTKFAGVTGYMADRTLALSFLTPFTQAGKHAFGMDFQGHVADVIGQAWGELTPEFRGFLEKSGLDEADWIGLQRVRPDPGGFLKPADVQAVDRELALKYLGAIHRFTIMAVPEMTVRARAATFADTRPGTIPGDLTRLVMQFKGFPVGVLFLHSLAFYRDIGGGNWRSGAMNAGALLINMTLFGAVAMQLKELANGRDPRAMDSAEFWGAAVLQGGGLGIYGDFMFADLNRFGGGLSSTVAGPVIGRLDNLRNLTLGNIQELASDETNFGREAVRFLRQNTPGGSIWYLRLAYNRMLLDQLQYAADPQAYKAFRRQQANRRRDYGQGYWWAPGDFNAARAPDLRAAF